MYKVMFVDDEPWAIIDLMHTIPWEDIGFTVAGYCDKPTTAINEILSVKPDIVFTDIRMPVWDGFELIKRCRESGAESEFIILSSYSDFLLTKQAIKTAVLDYCLKPVNPTAMIEMLTEMRTILDDKYAGQPLQAEEDIQEENHTERFNDILDYIKENYHHKLALTHLANHFHFNKNYICHLFKKHAKTTFITYLTQLRIDAAKELLRDSSLSQVEIAASVGFSNCYYFNKVFKAECGYTPAQYRIERV